jgi:resuscitation-promoting factor RpfB
MAHMTATRPSTGAGWYPDPSDPQRIRYWDGTSWTEQTLVAPPSPARGSRPASSTSGRRPWWQTWWVVVPLLVVYGVGLMPLWLRKGTSTRLKSLLSLAVVAVFGAVLLSPDASSDTTSAAPPPPRVSSPTPTPTAEATHKAPPPRARVPALRGDNLADVRAQLRARHLTVGTVARQPSALPPGTVISQGVGTGREVRRGTSISLVIAVPLPRVPAVTSHAQAVAVRMLRGAGFRVHVSQRTVTTGTNGLVLSQSPFAGQSVRPHAWISIVVAHVVRPVAPAPTQSPSCTPGYSPCLAPAYDYDCAGGSGDGPMYTGLVRVTGSDPYDLDADGDGWGCTS